MGTATPCLLICSRGGWSSPVSPGGCACPYPTDDGEDDGEVTAIYVWGGSEGPMRVAVKRLNLDRHPEPLTRRQTGEVLAKIDIPVTCANVNDRSFGSVYPQPSLGGSGRILQTRRSGPPGSVVLSQSRNFPSRIETTATYTAQWLYVRSQSRNFPSRIETIGPSELSRLTLSQSRNFPSRIET